jgi:hypothetical protein
MFNIASAAYCVINSYLDGETMNWLLTGACGIGGIALMFFKETQQRRAVDEQGSKPITSEIASSTIAADITSPLLVATRNRPDGVPSEQSLQSMV